MSKREIDWDAIEKDWRVGIKTKLEMSQEYSVSRAAMDKHFAKLGIERDLTAQIQAKADALVTRDAVTREVTSVTKLADKELIEANAELQARIRREQRGDISRSRKLCMSLLSELEETTGNIELFKQLGELMYEPDEKGVDKRAELYQKVLSLSGRTSNMKSLADSLKTLVTLEREAFGIKVADDPEDLGKRITKIERVIVG